MEINIDDKRNNPLLNRTEIHFTVIHKGEKTPDRELVRTELAEKLNAKKENVVVNYINPSFGLSESIGYAKVYDSKKGMEELEREYVLKRNTPGGAKKEKPKEEGKSEEPKKEESTEETDKQESEQKEKEEETQEKPEEQKTEGKTEPENKETDKKEPVKEDKTVEPEQKTEKEDTKKEPQEIKEEKKDVPKEQSDENKKDENKE